MRLAQGEDGLPGQCEASRNPRPERGCLNGLPQPWGDADIRTCLPCRLVKQFLGRTACLGSHVCRLSVEITKVWGAAHAEIWTARAVFRVVGPKGKIGPVSVLSRNPWGSNCPSYSIQQCATDFDLSEIATRVRLPTAPKSCLETRERKGDEGMFAQVIAPVVLNNDLGRAKLLDCLITAWLALIAW